jgi:subtilisin family serine protease
MKARFIVSALVVGASVLVQSGAAQAPRRVGPRALEQIRQLIAEKRSPAGVYRKLDPQLVYALKASRGETLTPALPSMPVNGVDINPSGAALVDIRGAASGALTSAIVQARGQVIHASAAQGSIRARVPLQAVTTLAARADVSWIRPGPHPRPLGHPARLVTPRFRGPQGLPELSFFGLNALNPFRLAFSVVGSVTTQGDIAHQANLARNDFHVDGTGVRIGVLSDSVEALHDLIGTGDLPSGVVVVQDIAYGPGTSEGTAMMEIIHDLAPGAQLFFASAFNGEESFADNIRTLRFQYGCDILVDDVSYGDEGAFQDTTIARAVNDVTADGALYFSSAGNSGSMTAGTSGTWEGDFVDFGGLGLNDFGGLPLNVLTVPAADIVLQWSDPFGHSCNDYDLFLLDPTGESVLAASVGPQTCSQDPVEEIFYPFGFDAGSLIVVVGNPGVERRAIHLDTAGSQLLIATQGSARGHNAGAATVSVAAVYWNSARTGTRPFTGGAQNPTELFSSDGPRRVFLNPDGSPITAGNVLFSTRGGRVLAKPDFAAADGVTTRTPHFAPFFGTSAAAPHAAAIAGLVKSARPGLTNRQIYAILASTALDIRAPGFDSDSGYGLVMARAAVARALQ